MCVCVRVCVYVCVCVWCVCVCVNLLLGAAACHEDLPEPAQHSVTDVSDKRTTWRGRHVFV